MVFLLIGAFCLHLAHQLFPHHHHIEQVVAASHSHKHADKDHHHHTDSENQNPEPEKNWLDELLSFIHHGKTDNPVQSGNQIKADFCKLLTIIPSVFDGIPNFKLPNCKLTLPSYAPPEQKPQQHVILFKSRRGPPAMA